MTAAVLEECWEYLDPKSVKRGPFATMRMAAWYEHQMLPEDLAVRHNASMPFIPIKELFHPPLVPFKSRPKPYVAPPAQPTGWCQFHWQYRDTKGFLQGPFSSEQMARWYEHGMLPERLQLKRTLDAQFSTIKSFFPEPLTPFVSQPVNPWGAAALAPSPAPTAQAKANEKAKQLQQQQQQAVQQLQMQLQMQLQLQQQIGQMSAQKHQAQAAQASAAPANSSNGNSNNHNNNVNNNNSNSKAARAQPQTQAQGANSRAAKAPQKNDAAAAGYPGAQNGGGSAASEVAHESHNSKNTNTKENAKGRNNKNAAKEQSTEDWWSDQGWAGGDKWWDQSWWTGWSGDGWEQSGHESNGKGKQRGGGADWKGAADADRTNASPPKEKTAGAVQAAFGSLRWGPPAEPADLFPEPTLRKILDEGIVWEERWVSPLAIRFSQGKIHPFFHERGPISEVLLQIKVSTDNKAGGSVQRIDPPFPPIRLLHLKQQGVLVTLDNRRLYALQRFALQEWPAVCLAKALCVDELTPTRLRAENRKFTNKLCGLQLEIESRSNAFETFSWVTDTAHVEAPRFMKPIAFRAADKSISLLPLLVVHTLMSPRFRDLLQSRWPLLEFAARLLPNPSTRSFPTKRILLQHVLELSRPGGRTVFACPAVCVAYKSETVVTLRKGRSTVQSKLAVQRPLALLNSSAPISLIQRRVLLALLPLLCLPYARSALSGSTREWVTAVLLALGKVNVARLEIGAAPLPSAGGGGGGAA